MKKYLIAAVLYFMVATAPAYAMFGNTQSEKVPAWSCSTEMVFKNGDTRTYQLNTRNVFHKAERSDHQWSLEGNADSTGGKLTAKVYDLNGRGTITYYSTDGKPFGTGKIHCSSEKLVKINFTV